MFWTCGLGTDRYLPRHCVRYASSSGDHSLTAKLLGDITPSVLQSKVYPQISVPNKCDNSLSAEQNVVFSCEDNVAKSFSTLNERQDNYHLELFSLGSKGHNW